MIKSAVSRSLTNKVITLNYNLWNLVLLNTLHFFIFKCFRITVSFGVEAFLTIFISYLK